MTTYGVIGWPVAHSRSPQMHNAAFRHLGLSSVYGRFPVPPQALGTALAGIRALGIGGVNVTLPHKEAVVALLDEVDEAATAMGAVNTIVQEDDRLVGMNTDAPGLVRALEEAGSRVAGAHVTVLGSGGAARAAVYGVARAGARAVAVSARRPDRAAEMVATLGPALGNVKTTVHDLAGELADPFAETDILIQATSATLGDGAEATRFASALPLDRLAPSALVTDLVYEPEKTALLRAAEARGLATESGLGMLLHQGALAFEAFTGMKAPLEIMRSALLKDVTRGGRGGPRGAPRA